mmetsp:Transcript_35496/g.33673  ORF Transcript_35496/g.33673 Transcript_35496/m.33673 type:complete len:247 (+) Transcript_35496:244-984(+)
MATTSIYKDQFDIIDVQDKIKKLQIKKKKILLERDEINEEISIYESKKKKQISELNVLLPMGELRFINEKKDEIEDEYSGQITETLFNDLNRKLELQILNKEIKGALNSLEKNALSWEVLIHKKEKEAQKMGKKIENIPSFYTQNMGEVYKDIGKNIENIKNNKLEITDLMRLDIQKKRKEKNGINHEIGQLRDDINSTLEERELLKSAANKTTIYLNNELIRIKTLQNEENKMKKLFENYKTSKQ